MTLSGVFKMEEYYIGMLHAQTLKLSSCIGMDLDCALNTRPGYILEMRNISKWRKPHQAQASLKTPALASFHCWGAGTSTPGLLQLSGVLMKRE
jgi:hypothetical protein